MLLLQEEKSQCREAAKQSIEVICYVGWQDRPIHLEERVAGSMSPKALADRMRRELAKLQNKPEADYAHYNLLVLIPRCHMAFGAPDPGSRHGMFRSDPLTDDDSLLYDIVKTVFFFLDHLVLIAFSDGVCREAIVRSREAPTGFSTWRPFHAILLHRRRRCSRSRRLRTNLSPMSTCPMLLLLRLQSSASPTTTSPTTAAARS
jgi:hypothetical protein